MERGNGGGEGGILFFLFFIAQCKKRPLSDELPATIIFDFGRLLVTHLQE